MEEYEKRTTIAEKKLEALAAKVDKLEKEKKNSGKENGKTSKGSSGEEEKYKKLVEQLRKERDEAIAKANKLELENAKLKKGETVTSETKQSTGDQIVASTKFSKKHDLTDRVEIIRLLKGEDTLQFVGKKIVVAGWARTIREQGGGRFAFIELNDGSCFSSFQIVVDADKPGFKDIMASNVGTGAAIAAEGLVVASKGKEQAIEMQAEKVTLLGACNPTEYPLGGRGYQRLETLRAIAHLRARTNTFGAMARIRNACAFATHRFFQEQGFFYVHTPVITASDCEGAGEMFQVTTLLKNGAAKISDIPQVQGAPGKIDYKLDFFEKPAFLTVSGQLNGEMYATALGKIYTFGPTFRAEMSHTTRHIAEFWMIEPEMAFCDIHDNMDVAEAYLKYVIAFVMKNNMDDLEFFHGAEERRRKELQKEKGKLPDEKLLIDRLKDVLHTPFKRLTYTEAVDILLKVTDRKFEVPVSWGIDLQSEHERYITEEVFKQPVILTNYPKDIKAFYMRLNDDGKTVAAMDVLVPKIGEIIGGSQREERLANLEKRIDELKLDKEAYKYYLDLRRYGSVVHSGFGLGFERLVMFISGIENIRDAIPFPRFPGHADF